jgi:hypothetical protein
MSDKQEDIKEAVDDFIERFLKKYVTCSGVLKRIGPCCLWCPKCNKTFVG